MHSRAARYLLVLCAVALLIGAIAPVGLADNEGPGVTPAPNVPASPGCANGGTPANIHGKSKCLKAGQKCNTLYQGDYKINGFKCKGKKNKNGKKVYKLKAIS